MNPSYDLSTPVCKNWVQQSINALSGERNEGRGVHLS